MLELCFKMLGESPYNECVKPGSADFIKALSSFHLITECNEVGEPIGFILGLINNQHPLFGNIDYAIELAWYVHPDYRGKGTAIKLLEAFEAWANENGAKLIFCSAMHNDSLEQVDKMYTKKGYKPVELAYMKELK